MRSAGLQLARAVCRRATAPATIAPLQLAGASLSTSSARSPRARRLRRAKAAQSAAAASPPKPSSSLYDSINLVASIDEISSNGLACRVEMPEELLERITAIVRARSHSQLETLREKLRATSGAVARGIPLDMHTRPLGWTLDKSQQIKPFAYGPQETLAYLAFEVEDAFACAHNVMSELKRRLPAFAPRSMLDFGAGPGTSSWVARGLFDDSLTSYRVVEPSQSMVDAATSILDGFPGLSVRRSIADMAREIGAADDDADGGRYDLITANFVLSDLTSDFERVAVTSALWELLADGGCLVIVDHGSPWGSHQVRSARQFVLDTVNEQDGEDDEDEEDEGKKAGSGASDRVRIVAPCPHQHECPATGGTWCHFVQRAPKVQYPRVATTKRWHGQKGAKFSYVILQKPSRDADKQEKGKLARLVRGPLLATRHVHLDLCMPEGELERRSVTKGKAIREVYRASRKAHWGASWPADASIYKNDKSK